MLGLQMPFDLGEGVAQIENGAYVYFIRRGDDDVFKIGIATDLDRRVKELQTGNSEDLIVYAAIKTNAPRQLEVQLHTALSKYRRRGEWFSLTKDKVELILQGYRNNGAELVFMDCENSKKGFFVIDARFRKIIDDIPYAVTDDTISIESVYMHRLNALFLEWLPIPITGCGILPSMDLLTPDKLQRERDWHLELRGYELPLFTYDNYSLFRSYFTLTEDGECVSALMDMDGKFTGCWMDEHWTSEMVVESGLINCMETGYIYMLEIPLNQPEIGGRIKGVAERLLEMINERMSNPSE